MVEEYIFSLGGKDLALFKVVETDMWYLFGQLRTEEATQESLNCIINEISQLDFRAAMGDWKKGYQCILKTEKHHLQCVLMGYVENQAVVIRIIDQKSQDWVRENVPEMKWN